MSTVRTVDLSWQIGGTVTWKVGRDTTPCLERNNVINLEDHPINFTCRPRFLFFAIDEDMSSVACVATAATTTTDQQHDDETDHKDQER
mmetsp:Transcript_42776/g.103240  ORF Transcript_42776/g.103240 Transcript_42776/m.103240 type:complete len:89 (-) Transcript_42776:403-669(-)